MTKQAERARWFFQTLEKFLDMPIIGTILDFVLGCFLSLIRFGVGYRAAQPKRRPEKAMSLYEYEICPACRDAREAFAVLDLPVTVYPTPRVTLREYMVVRTAEGESRFRPEVEKISGKQQYPLFIDPNTDTMLQESKEIAGYLFKTYGGGDMTTVAPLEYRMLNTLPVRVPTVTFMARPIPRMGMLMTLNNPPLSDGYQPLVFYGIEAAPTARIVREVLCTLELPYVSCPVSLFSGNKTAMARHWSRHSNSIPIVDRLLSWLYVYVPTLYDPNTDTLVTGCAKIKRYLYARYAASMDARPAKETIADYSTKGATSSHLTLNSVSDKKSK